MITLRAVEPEDVNMIFASENDASAWDSSDTTAPLSRHLIREYALNYRADPFGEGQLKLMAVDTCSNETVGIFDLYDISPLHSHAWLGIYVLPAFRGKGFGEKIVSAGLEYARKRLKLSNIGAKIPTANKPSVALFEKCGFQPCGILHQWHFANGCHHDIALYQHIFSLHS